MFKAKNDIFNTALATLLYKVEFAHLCEQCKKKTVLLV